MDSIASAIVGVTGYEGIVLARLLARHPRFRLIEVTARTYAGQTLGEALPSLTREPIGALPITEAVREAELIFVAAPHGAAGEIAAGFRREGRRVIDLSADFRLRDVAVYAQWYKRPHPAPDILPEAVYGLSELAGDALHGANLVANPGCFPTGALLALTPAVECDLLAPEVIVDAKTAVSGAGRSPTRRTHFVETSDSVTAYGVEGHRHLPEMEQELAARTSGEATQITFIPHLVPMNRGILSTCYATLRPRVTSEAVMGAYRARYAGKPFVTILDFPPETGWVRGSNQCLLSLTVDESRRRLVVVSAIDNLMKGGAGQAVQNANLMYGYDETTGLDQAGVWP